MNHSRWKLRRAELLFGEAPEPSRAYVEAGYALALGQAVYDRRTALRLSRNDLARQADMTAHQISTIEGGGTVPTPDLLTRLAGALDATATADLDADNPSVVFTPHPTGDR